MYEIINEDGLPMQQSGFLKKQSICSNPSLQVYTNNESPKCYKRPSQPSISLIQKVSLLHRHPCRESLLTVFYFETEFHCTFDLSELVSSTTVRKFIEIAVDQYCAENYQFTPEGIDTNTYELKLADLENKHDRLIDPIDQSDFLSMYAGNSLCLLRIEQKHSNRELYQQKLGDFEVFQVDINMSFIREQDRIHHMNHIIQMPRGCTVGELMNKVISNCSIHDMASACVLVEYHRLVRHPLSHSTVNIPERKFELLKARNKFYLDEPEQFEDCILPIEIKVGNQLKSTDRQITSDRLQPYPFEILNQLEYEESTSIQVDNGIQNLLGRCCITIDKANFIEKTEQSTLSRLVGLVWERRPQQVYPLAALISVSADPQQLRLVFAIKSKAITKRYRLMSGCSCRKFVEELLRRCRLLKKTLAEWRETK